MTLCNDFDTPLRPVEDSGLYHISTNVILFLNKMYNLCFVSSGNDNKNKKTLLKGQTQFSFTSYDFFQQHCMLDAEGDKWKQVKHTSKDNPLDGRLTLSMMITPPNVVCACMFGAANQTPLCKQHVFEIFLRNWFSQLYWEWEFDFWACYSHWFLTI